MSPQRLLLAAGVVLTALLLQVTVVARLPLAGGRPDLLLVVVVAVALREGVAAGMVSGFAAGLLADLLTDHEVGRLALAYVVAGYVAGQLHDRPSRSLLLPLGAVALGAVAALLAYGLEGLLLGDPRTGLAPVLRGLVTAVPYDVVLAPLVVPVVGLLVRLVPGERGSRPQEPVGRARVLGSVR